MAAAAAAPVSLALAQDALTKPRTVVQRVAAVETPEGDGARVRRTLGTAGLRQLSPFLMLDHFTVTPPAGFPPHPHRGQSTVTWMDPLFDAEVGGAAFEHEDFRGHRGVIEPGDMQWMVAGRGILHSELPVRSAAAKAGEPARAGQGLQLWINLRRKDKMCEPEYQELKAAEIPRAEAGGVAVDVIAGRSMGVVSPVRTKTPTAYLHVNMAAGATLTQAISPGFNAFLYVLNGDGTVGQTVAASAGEAEAAVVGADGGVSAAAAAAAIPKPSPGSGTPVKRYETVVLSNKPGEDGVAVTAGPHGLRFVLISGEPIDEPVVQHGPFVVTSREEVMQAMDDYRGNKNGFEGAFAWEADWDRRHER